MVDEMGAQPPHPPGPSPAAEGSGTSKRPREETGTAPTREGENEEKPVSSRSLLPPPNISRCRPHQHPTQGVSPPHTPHVQPTGPSSTTALPSCRPADYGEPTKHTDKRTDGNQLLREKFGAKKIRTPHSVIMEILRQMLASSSLGESSGSADPRGRPSPLAW